MLLLNERRFEFAGESNRWWGTFLRTGKDDVVLSALALPAYPYSFRKKTFWYS
jgi:hypothetical protein